MTERRRKHDGAGSVYKGVTKVLRIGKRGPYYRYQANIKVDGVKIYIGQFKTESEAGARYLEYCHKYRLEP